jgi:hypothetical protein
MSTEWKYDLKAEDIPANCQVKISVRSDNLEEEDFPIAELLIEKGIIIEQISRNNGNDATFALPDFRGRDVHLLITWVNQNEDIDENYFPHIYHVMSNPKIRRK